MNQPKFNQDKKVNVFIMQLLTFFLPVNSLAGKEI